MILLCLRNTRTFRLITFILIYLYFLNNINRQVVKSNLIVPPKKILAVNLYFLDSFTVVCNIAVFVNKNTLYALASKTMVSPLCTILGAGDLMLTSCRSITTALVSCFCPHIAVPNNKKNIPDSK